MQMNELRKRMCRRTCSVIRIAHLVDFAIASINRRYQQSRSQIEWVLPKPRDLSLSADPGFGIQPEQTVVRPLAGLGPQRRSGCVPTLPYPPLGTEQLITKAT
jgi:hypothetical protein